jgi:hypothetical protein
MASREEVLQGLKELGMDVRPGDSPSDVLSRIGINDQMTFEEVPDQPVPTYRAKTTRKQVQK